MELKVNDITKQYRAGRVIFSNISHTFWPGTMTGFIGPNGSGKTTFLRLLSVNTFPTAGKIFYGDLDIHQKPHKYLKYVGLVHDDEQLPQYLTAVELLEWLLRSRKKWDENSRAIIENIFDKLELGDDRNEKIGTYSTGMRKKTQIAAALIAKPDILILDEPLRGLDKQAKAKVLEMFDENRKRGAIVLMASHAHDDADSFFDEILQFPLI